MNRVNVRLTMAGVPWAQPLLTWMTGKPLPGQRPFLPMSPVLHLASALLGLLAGLAGSALTLTFPVWAWPLGLLPCWVLTTGNARKLLVMICHQCVHHQFTGNKTIDRWVCEMVSVLIMVQDYAGYYHDHRDLHHSKQLATLEDPDLKFIIELGFRPGLSREALWRHLGWTLVSPRFHGLFLYYRLRANLLAGSSARRAAFVLLHGGMPALAFATGHGLAYVLAWLVPMTLLYHVSGLLQFLGEHRWLRVRRPDEPARVYLARLTAGRFSGQPAPEPGLPWPQAVARWTAWTASMLTYHLLCRAFVLVADLPAHDWHHRHPSTPEWTQALYARQRDIDAGCPRWGEPYSEVWGLHNAIDQVFELFSTLGDAEYDTRPMPLPHMEEVLRSM